MDTNNITIRPFRRADAKAVAVMLRRLAAFHGDKAKTKPDHFLEHAIGPNKSSFVWVAFHDKKPIGFAEASFRMNFLGGMMTMRVGLLHVEEAYRRNGIGSLLIQEAIGLALKKKCGRFDISAAPNNKLSNGLYVKLGLVKRKPEYLDYNADPAIMKKIAESLKGPNVET